MHGIGTFGQLTFGQLPDFDAAEEVTLDKWHQQPVTFAGGAFAVALLVSGAVAPVFVPAPAETVTVDKWLSEISQPQTVQSLGYVLGVAGETVPPPAATGVIEWLIRARRRGRR